MDYAETERSCERYTSVVWVEPFCASGLEVNRTLWPGMPGIKDDESPYLTAFRKWGRLLG